MNVMDTFVISSLLSHVSINKIQKLKSYDTTSGMNSMIMLHILIATLYYMEPWTSAYIHVHDCV